MTDSSEYIIGYVDENDDDILLFQQQFSDHFNIVPLELDLSTNIGDVISWVFDSHLDLIIVDFDLKEKLEMDFCGNDILETLNEQYLNFPMFMLTSYELRAINESDASIDDVIYSKNDVYNNIDIFVMRFVNKIVKYKSEINKAKIRHEELAKKSELTFEEEDEFLNLDDFIEKVHDKKGSKPKIMKNSKSLEKLNELVDKADIILQKIDRND